MTDEELMTHVRECQEKIVIRNKHLICKKHNVILESP